mgnify:CR=1 FL=1
MRVMIVVYCWRGSRLGGLAGCGIFDVTIDLRDAIDSNVIQGPRMLCGGNALLTSVGGTAGRLIPDRGLRGYAKIVSTPEEIKTEVRRQIKNGVDLNILNNYKK